MNKKDCVTLERTTENNVPSGFMIFLYHLSVAKKYFLFFTGRRRLIFVDNGRTYYAHISLNPNISSGTILPLNLHFFTGFMYILLKLIFLDVPAIHDLPYIFWIHQHYIVAISPVLENI